MATQETARMPFGKHKNKPIGEIDPTYLEWVLANCQQISPDLKRAICTQLGLEVKDDPKDKEIAELQARSRSYVRESWCPGWRLMTRAMRMGRAQELHRDKVREWHRSLAQDYQGSTEAMTAVNDAYDRLRKALEFRMMSQLLNQIRSGSPWKITVSNETCCWITPNSSRRGMLSHGSFAPMAHRLHINCHTIDMAPSTAIDDDSRRVVRGIRGTEESRVTPRRSATNYTATITVTDSKSGRSEAQFDRSPR